LLNLDQLYVSQEQVREKKALIGMIRFVKSGLLWTKEQLASYHFEEKTHIAGGDLIAISRFPDGFMLVHDGHHRCVATYLASRNELHNEEYAIKDWRYEDYTVIEFKNCWVTPFDPRIECRLANFWPFKQKVLQIYKDEGEEKAIWWIKNNKEQYCHQRTINTVPDLANCLQSLQLEKVAV